jgi:beta-N-acetylhexosaminidase
MSHASPSWVDSTLERMTIEEKVGQLVMAGFPGLEPDSGICRLLRERHLGSVVLFGRNCDTPQQVARLTADLQNLSRLPLLIAVDQEGGTVARLRSPATVFPSNMAIGATGRTDDAYTAAACTAEILRRVGITMNLAPVLDVNSNPQNPIIGTRSFGEDVAMVSALGVAAIEGYQDNGIMATAKHFPGHGNTAVDSHAMLPVVHASLEELERTELPPFEDAITAGVAAVMTAHILFPALGTRHPATLSYEALGWLLRTQLGYDGIVITDCMEMKAIADNYGMSEAAVMAIQAGADIVLISHTYEHQAEALDALLQAARERIIPPHRLDRSVRRILTAKERFALEQLPAKEQAAWPDPIHEAAARDIAQRSVTLIKDDKGWLPISSRQRVALVECTLSTVTGVEDRHPSSPLLSHALAKRLPDMRSIAVAPDLEAQRLPEAMAMAQEADIIIVATRNAGQNPGQVRLVHDLLSLDKPVIVVALRSPFDLLSFIWARAYLCTYGDPPCSLEAVADVLCGAVPPQGHLPVTIPGQYPRGHGLMAFVG